jgi:hypothetical protein
MEEEVATTVPRICSHRYTLEAAVAVVQVVLVVVLEVEVRGHCTLLAPLDLGSDLSRGVRRSREARVSSSSATATTHISSRTMTTTAIARTAVVAAAAASMST